MDQEFTTDTADESEVPAVIVLGDAAALTRGGADSGVESKQTPYD
ncbi:albusnodin family lasso peptide [Streptomyces sp. NPDC046887]